MNLKPTKTGLAMACGVVALVAAACGSDPKPDPNAATATPSATPAASTAAPTVASAAPSASAAPAVDPKIAQCSGYRDDANSSLDAKRIEVDKDCKKDADCVPIKGRACGFDCVTGAIPKSLEKDWNASVAKIKDGQCKQWDSNDCSKVKTSPTPTCQDRKVACDKGRCILKEPK